MGFLRQAHGRSGAFPDRNATTINEARVAIDDKRGNAARRRTSMSDKLAIFKRSGRRLNNGCGLQRTQSPKNERGTDARNDRRDDAPGEDRLGDIPRLICMALGNESPGNRNDIVRAIDTIGSACDLMSSSSSLRDDEQDASDSNLWQWPTLEKLNVDEETAGELVAIMQQSPSLDHLPYYIDALSPEISPDPSGELSLRALRHLFALSEHSSHRQQCIDMIKLGAISDLGDARSAGIHNALIPALLAFIQRCPMGSSANRLALLVLNNLSIPNENKRTIALDCGGVKVLNRLLRQDPGCEMLLIIIVQLTFGDENYPLVDPEDPITRRLMGRVARFLDVWKKKGMPLDFRPFYGVNTGLCTL